jgi:hypothetical protein
VRHHDVQRVRRAALEEYDQHLAARISIQRRAFQQILREDSAPQKARVEADGGQR